MVRLGLGGGAPGTGECSVAVRESIMDCRPVERP